MIKASEVKQALLDSLYEPREVDGNQVLEGFPQPKFVEGINTRFAFHPDRLMGQMKAVSEWLTELTDDFRKDKGGGASFLNLCVTKNGNQWGEHQDCQNLMALAIGLELMNYCAPKEMWNLFPGGMPYLVVNLNNNDQFLEGINDG